MDYLYDRSVKDESRLINALIIEPESREVIFERIAPEHFADPVGRNLYESFVSCWRRNIPLDSDGTIMHLIKPGDPKTDEFLNQGIPGNYPARWQDSVEICDRFELVRQILLKGQKAMDGAQLADKTRTDLLEDIRAMWTPVIEAPVTSATKSLGAIIDSEYEQHRQAKEGLRRAVPWGLVELDRMAPMYPGQMAIVGARPGMGKTALEITCSFAQIKAGVKVGIICVEQDNEDILRRYYSQVSGLSYQEIQRGMRGSPDDKLQFYERARSYMRQYDGKLFIHGGEKCSIERIRAITFDWVKNHGVQAVWLDYLTDFRLPKRKDYHLEVEAMSQEIRDLSRSDKLNVPVYLCSQLNRSGADGYPRPSQLKGSSGLEQDAHVIVLVDRPDNEPTANRPYLDGSGATRDMKGKAALHIAKNRNGSTGLVFTDFIGQSMEFKNESRYSGEEV